MSASLSARHLTAMLDLHHQRMVARLRNIMDSLTHRACSETTVGDEIAFLTLEVEAYRAFVHRHADTLVRATLDGDADEVRAEADSLYFEVLQLSGLLEAREVPSAPLLARLSRLGGDLLGLAQRTHHLSVQLRNDRLARLRDFVHAASRTAEQWPRDPAGAQSVAMGND